MDSIDSPNYAISLSALSPKVDLHSGVDITQPPSTSGLAAADSRATAASEIDALAKATEHPISGGLAGLARLVRCDWPGDTELGALTTLAGDLAGMQRVNDEMHATALTRLTEAETVRQQGVESLAAMVAAHAAPPASSDASTRVEARLSALETYLSNMQIKVERNAAANAHAKDDLDDVRSRLSRTELENAGLRRKVAALESELEHVHRVLEAAAAFAGEAAVVAAAPVTQ